MNTDGTPRSLPFKVIGLFTRAFAIVALLGMLFDAMGIGLTPVAFATGFSLIGATYFWKNRVRLETSWETGVTTPFLWIVGSWSAVLLALDGRGHLFPVSSSVDSAAHYALAEYIRAHAALPHADFPFLWEIAKYPFGFHLSVALLSRLFGVPLIQLIYPTAIFISALTVGAVFASSSELVPSGRRLGPLLAALLVATSWHFVNSIGPNSFWPMNLAILIILVFAWILSKSPVIELQTLIELGILEGGLILTYAHWAGIPLLLLAGDSLLSIREARLNKLLATVLLGAYSVCIAIIFAHDRVQAGSYILGVEGGITRDLMLILKLLCVTIVLASIGATRLWASKGKVFVVLAFVVLLHAAAFFLAKQLFSFGSYYVVLKLIYPLIPVLAVCASASVEPISAVVDRIHERLLIERFSRRQALSAAWTLLIGIHLAIFIGKVRPHSLMRPMISEATYHAALWTKENIRDSSVVYLADGPTSLWLYAITGKPLKTTLPEWWIKPGTSLPQWVQTAAKNEIALIPAANGDVHLPESHALRSLFSEGTAEVVARD